MSRIERPRIHFLGDTTRLTLWPGDIVFISGNYEKDLKLPFEHVAIVGGTVPVKVRKAQDLLDLIVVGVPESISESHPGLHPIAAGRVFYLPHIAQLHTSGDRRLSDPQIVWNLAGRVFSSSDEGSKFVLRLARSYAKKRFQFDIRAPEFKNVTDDDLNCVGFVCAAFRQAGLPLLGGPIGIYTWPFTRNPTNFKEVVTEIAVDVPAPGHLARALSGAVDIPYSPSTSEEARKYSRVSATRADLLGRRPWWLRLWMKVVSLMGG